MSVPVFKNREWDLTRSKYDAIDDYPFMKSPGPVLMIMAVYLLFVLKVGPAFMRKREAYKLKTALVVYNAVQVALSVYLMFRYLYYIYSYGLFPKACYIDRDDTRETVITGIWLYLFAKLTELFDTIFFVFRKKDNQISFLHLYHHSIMVVGTWAMLKYAPSHLLNFIGFLNSMVHVFMYTYYGLAVFGNKYEKYLTWKKYMTSIQLIQFVMIIIHYIVAVKISDCPPSRLVATMVALNTVFILLLFANFYRQNYRRKASKKNEANGNVSAEPVMNLVDSNKVK